MLLQAPIHQWARGGFSSFWAHMLLVIATVHINGHEQAAIEGLFMLGLAEQQGPPALQMHPLQAPSTSSMSSDSDRTQAGSGERPQARPAHSVTAHAMCAL